MIALRKQLDVPSDEPAITLVQPSTTWVPLKLSELWDYRELLFFFVWADLKVRYKQTVLGAAWAVIQPFFTMVVFSIFFGRLAGVSSDGVPYPVFAYTALVPWTYFATSLSNASNSLLNARAVITKVYFPRLLLPISSTLTGLVDFAIAFSVVVVLMFYYGIVPSLAVLALPFFVILAAATALSLSLWLAALNAEYRDIRYVVPFLLQIWLFLTPVAYSGNLVPERWQTIYGLNPMAGVIEGFRWALLGQERVSWSLVLVSTLMVVALLIGGLFYFRRMERSFVDVA
jgi:lipopolysaccharide transport system permease protein